MNAFAVAGRRMQSVGATTGMIESPSVCRQDIGSKIQDGGVVFFAPLFDDMPYCRYARGVMMFQTNNFIEGEYLFTGMIESYDGRSASQDVYIEITNVRVPRVVLNVFNAKDNLSLSLSTYIYIYIYVCIYIYIHIHISCRVAGGGGGRGGDRPRPTPPPAWR